MFVNLSPQGRIQFKVTPLESSNSIIQLGKKIVFVRTGCIVGQLDYLFIHPAGEGKDVSISDRKLIRFLNNSILCLEVVYVY